MASSFHFYEKLITELNTALNTYVHDTAGNIVGQISGVAYTLLMIYMMLWGWTTMRGMISEPITDGITRIVRLTVIVALAINLGRYESYLSNYFMQMPDALAAAVAGASAGSSVQYLDVLMSNMYDFGDRYYQAAQANSTMGIPDLGMLAIAYVVWLIGLLATAYAAFLFALAKLALSIVLGVGPIFILSLIFEGTKKLFDAWIGQVLNYIFMVMLSAAAVKLILTILQHYLSDATPSGADPGIDQALPAVALAAIGALVLTQVSSLASALGGGVAVSTLGAAAWAYGKTTGSFAAMRPTNLRREMNKLRSDGRIARGVLSNGVGGAAAARVAGAAAPAARGAGYAAGRAASVPMAVYRRITNARTNAVSKG